MAININTNFLSFQPLTARNAPDAVVLPISNIDFTRDTTYNVDLTATVQSAQLANPIQSVYIDASAIPFGVTMLTVFSTGQKILVRAGVQGYYPLFVAGRNYVFTVQNTLNLGQAIGTASLNVYFSNVPVVASEWNVYGDSGSGGSGLQGGSRIVTAATDQALLTDYTLLCNATANAITEYLPAAGGVQSILNIAKTDATANTVTINGNGFLIDNAPTFVMVQPGESVTVQWTGSNWKKLSQYPGINVDWGALTVGILDPNNPPSFRANGQAALDLRNSLTGGTPAAGAYWRLFVDNVGGGGGNNTVGFYDFRNNRTALGIDNNGRTNVISLDSANSITTPSATVSGGVSAASLAVTGNANAGSLAVSGATSTVSLTVTGNTATANVTTKGVTTFTDTATGNSLFQIQPTGSNGAFLNGWTGSGWLTLLGLFGSATSIQAYEKITLRKDVVFTRPDLIDFSLGWQTWNLGVAGTGGMTVSSVSSVAQYLRVGQMAMIKGVVNFSLGGTAAGTVTLTGLPFTNLGEQQVVTALFYSNVTGTGYSCYCVTIAGTTTLTLTLNAGASMPLGGTQIDIAFIQRCV